MTVPRVAAGRVTRLQVPQTETVPTALVSAHQQGRRAARFRIGQEVAQSSAEDRDGAAAFVLEYQQVKIRIGDFGLQAQQTHGRIQDKPVPGRPGAPARPAGLEGAGRGLDDHIWNYKGASVRLPGERHFGLERGVVQRTLRRPGLSGYRRAYPAASDLVGIYEDVGAVLIALGTSSVPSFRFSTSVSDGAAISAIRTPPAIISSN